MQKSRFWIIIVVILILLNVCTLTFLWKQHSLAEREGTGPATKEFILKEIGLTRIQQIQYDSLRKIHHKIILNLNRQNRELHDQLFENIKIENIDSSTVNNITHEIM